MTACDATGSKPAASDTCDAGASCDPDEPGSRNDPGSTGDVGSDPGGVDPGTGEDDLAVAGEIKLKADSVTSESVSLSWAPVSDAVETRVSIGPEPPDATTGKLPLEEEVAVLDGAADTYTVQGVAAATDLFVHVEVARDGLDPQWGNVHARTLGGPRAQLATPLREVHAYGPKVLMLVLANPRTRYSNGSLAGNTGGSWQAGSWSVTRHDGSAIPVTQVYRHTIPVSQPDYPVGYNQYGDGNVVNLDHRIFLVLGEAVGQRELLRVTHAGAAGTALETVVPFSDRYLETPLVQVNQVGYNPRASRRWAYVSGWMGNGGGASLADLPDNAEVLVEPLNPLHARSAEYTDLPITVRSTHDSWAGTEVREIDLSGVRPAEGVRYRVRIPGVGVSWPTAVSEEAAFKAFYTVWRGLFHNRWCGDLSSEVTDWSRPPDHCHAYFVQTGRVGTDGFFPSSTPTNPGDLKPLVGGHHDAGDFDIRPYHVMVGQYLLRAFELGRDGFTDGELTLPESGNDVPDTLDEALWSVAAWRQLQNADGGVRSGVESFRHPAGIYHANDDQLPYWTFDPVPWHTAYSAALLAQAAYDVREYDLERAAELQQAAVRAYDWASSHNAPAAYRLYAAGELYRLTGQSSYDADFRSQWSSMGNWGGGPFENMASMSKIYPGAFTGYTPAMADFLVAYVQSPGADQTIVSTTLRELTSRADAAANQVINAQAAHRHGRPLDVAPDWGADTATGHDGDFIYQRLQLGNLDAAKRQDYIDALSLSADYVLGCNPAGTTFITGLGSRSPQEALHNDSLSFMKELGMPPLPGIPVFGPVNSLPNVSYYEPVAVSFYPSFGQQPGGYRFADTRASVNTSEFSVWEASAPLAELFAALVGPGMTPPADWLPGQPQHRSTLPPQTGE